MIDTTGPGLFYRDVSHEVTDWSGTSSSTVNRTVQGILPDRYDTSKEVTLQLSGVASADFWLEQQLAPPVIAQLFPSLESQMEAYARGKIEWGSIEPHLDLPRSIAELKDFSGVFKSLLGNLKNIAASTKSLDVSTVLEAIRVEIKRKASSVEARLPKNAGELLDTGISADLTWKFAIKPLISDVNRVMELSKKAEQLMQKLATSETFPVRGRFSQSTNQSKTVIPSSGAQKASMNLRGTHTCVAWAMIETSAHMDTSFYEALRAVAGIRFQWRTVWELVPLSFVVDWFVKVGNLVSYLDRGSGFQRTFRIVSSGYSHKKEFVGTGYVEPLYAAASELGASWIATPVANGVVTKKTYNRIGKFISPSDAGLPPPLEYGLPSFGQVVTLVELILSFLRSKRG